MKRELLSPTINLQYSNLYNPCTHMIVTLYLTTKHHINVVQYIKISLHLYHNTLSA